MLNALISFCQELAVTVGYPGIILVAFLENFFPPLPSEVVFPFMGFVAARGAFTLHFVVVAGVTGALIGALFWYLAGYWLGSIRLKRFIAERGKILHIKLGDIERAEYWFERYERPAVFFARLIPLVRTFISVPAGFVRMNLLLFSLLTVAGSTIWIGLLSYAGYVLGDRWGVIVPYLERYEMIIGILAIGVIAIFIVKGYKSKSR